jgi:branched-chain amino acid transport system ATP-binding protein
MLESRHLSVSYGQHRAVEQVSLKIDRAEIVALLGANGAGKSSIIRAIAGQVRVSPDSLLLMDGENITGWPPYEVVETGIAVVPEDRGIFEELTVRDNLILGGMPRRARQSQAKHESLVFDLFPRLAERQHQIVRTMSGGERQMVAIGRALMSAPSILLLDEPSLGLSPGLCTTLFRALEQIKSFGVGIFLVEQNAHQSLRISDRVYLLENGKLIGSGRAKDLAQDERVRASYLGATDHSK